MPTPEQIHESPRLETTIAQTLQFPGVSGSVAKARGARFPASPDVIIFIAVVGDFFAILAASSLAILSRRYFDFGIHTNGFAASDYINGVLLGSLLYLFLFQLNGAYRKHHFVQRRLNILNVCLKAAAMWTVAFLIITFAFKMQWTISRLYVSWAVLNSLVVVFAWRLVFRRFLYASNWAALLRDRVLVVGWSQESDSLARQIARDPGHPYEVIGCTPSATGTFRIHPPERVAILGEYDGLRDLFREQQPDTLILTDMDAATGKLVALVQLCIKENVQFKVIPSFFQVFVSGLHLENISGVPMVGVSKLPLDHMHNRFLKQVVDILGAMVGLLLSAPLILLFGLLIYRESPGPIFYTQTRSGRGGRAFKMYKLRSMRLNAELNGPQWTKANDSRRLKIGEFIRKTSIDEVPQFWNVLKGDMSLVGPRPERPELIENFKEAITHYNARHFAKPGMTGYAQVNGMRGDTDLSERVRYDLFYLENWNLGLDLWIMLKTFFARGNAY